MSKKVRERAEMQWLFAAAQQYGIPLDAAWPFYCAVIDHLFPEVDKSTADERAAAIQRIFEYIDELDEEMQVELNTAVKVGQLKPTSLSDRRFVRDTLNKSGQLQNKPASPQHWVKRLTHTNGEAGDESAPISVSKADTESESA